MEMMMFETFNRTEESWGKAAHVKPEDLGRILASGDSLKKLAVGKGHKPFKVTLTETLEIVRKSEPATVYATSMDRVSSAAQEVTFDMIPSQVYEEVCALLEQYGLQVRPRTTYSIQRTK
jgi:hypothetical protein